MATLPASYDTWAPQTRDTLDLRLTSWQDQQKDETVATKKIVDMGDQLKYLYTQASFLGVSFFESLAKDCSSLEALWLNCAHRVNDTALEKISNLSNLQVLNLSGAAYRKNNAVEPITDRGAAYVINRCKKLHYLDLSGSNITKPTLQIIVFRKNLQVLKIENCSGLKPEDISWLLERRKDLTILKKDDATDATAKFIELAKAIKERCLENEPWEDSETGKAIYLKRPFKSEERALISDTMLDLL
ncbi:MAG: hypothetical protein KGJ02_03325 [Verrucomicrobiota bacterium]|nr:hypothetical protein [Verrucomicrobiota bacterium]